MAAAPALQEDMLTLARSLDPALLSRVMALRDWLVTVATRAEDTNDVLTGFIERLRDVGVPIDRAAMAIEALHSEYAGIGRFWTPEEGTAVRYLPHGERRDVVYQASPFAYVNRTGEWLFLDLGQTPDTLFPIIPEL
jgi:adenylate cyclase